MYDKGERMVSWKMIVVGLKYIITLVKILQQVQSIHQLDGDETCHTAVTCLEFSTGPTSLI